MDEDMKRERKQGRGLKMTNLDVMKQKIQQMDIDEAAEWFTVNCECPPDINCCPDEFVVEDDDWKLTCTKCWKKWFEKENEQ